MKVYFGLLSFSSLDQEGKFVEDILEKSVDVKKWFKRKG